MDEIAKAFTLLSSMKENVPKTFEVDESWVNDFHAALSQVEAATGITLQEFRISPSELRRETTGGNYLSGEVFYSGRNVVERSRFLVKLDAVLRYFSYEREKTTKGPIGFRKK